jgi:uncharacterized protein (DUF3820 family)
MDQSSLLKLAQWTMPFGRYEGWLLADLPEPYLVWYSHQGFPPGELGELLAQMLELRVNGLEYLLRPLRPQGFVRPGINKKS